MMLCIQPGLAQKTIDITASAGLGWVDNPFFDDDALRRVSANQGRTSNGQVLLDSSVPINVHHHWRSRLGGQIAEYGGTADALVGTARLESGWQWRGAPWVTDVMAYGQVNAIDRFETDTRWTGGGLLRVNHQLAARWRWSAALDANLRRFPNRIDVNANGDAQTDASQSVRLETTSGPWSTGDVRWWGTAAGSALRLASNANELARTGYAANAQVVGAFRTLTWQTGVGGWALMLPELPRQDTGIQYDAAVGYAVSDSVSLQVTARHIVGDSDAPAGRFRHWQTGLDLTFRTGWTASPRQSPLPLESGLQQLSDGRWRFTVVDEGAHRMALVGDFNDWRAQAHGMRLENGTWTIDLQLPPGRQTFMFLADGTRWMTPPFGAQLDDGFGRKVGVVWVD